MLTTILNKSPFVKLEPLAALTLLASVTLRVKVVCVSLYNG